jgi:hypothetical protein
MNGRQLLHKQMELIATHVHSLEVFASEDPQLQHFVAPIMLLRLCANRLRVRLALRGKWAHTAEVTSLRFAMSEIDKLSRENKRLRLEIEHLRMERKRHELQAPPPRARAATSL